MMKKIKFKLLLLSTLIVIVAFFGCKKDSGDENTFTFDNKTYKISYCSIDSYSNNQYSLLIATKGVKYDEANGTYTGDYNYIKVTLFSDGETDIKPGLYTIDKFNSEDDYTANFDYILIKNSDDDNLVSELKESGIVKIQRSGNKFKIDFEFYVHKNTYLDGNVIISFDQYEVKGYYEGSVVRHDLSAK